ncbi:MAG TPA: NAD(P)-binding domain-containing protein [Nannocystaceae bacterium]|nr:NAD(P)-binding domain-containing protein [Nannocystaceae bacterium]
MIAVLGTGLLGSGFARAALRRGEAVRVWNRTIDRARPLADDGAIVCDDPAATIRDATRVHVVLSDDAAVDDVLAAAEPGRGALILDHTTTSTAGARRRTAAWRERGITYVHAPVFMGPANALASTGLMLLSGDREVVAAVTPLLAPMTGQVVDLGSRVDAAAAFKLLGNLLLMAITGGFADMLALGKSMGVAPTEVAALLSSFNPGATLPARLQRMIDMPWDDPSWELAMARKDARLIEGELEGSGLPLAVIPGIAARMDAMIADGHGKSDWTVIAKAALS